MHSSVQHRMGPWQKNYHQQKKYPIDPCTFIDAPGKWHLIFVWTQVGILTHPLPWAQVLAVYV